MCFEKSDLQNQENCTLVTAFIQEPGSDQSESGGKLAAGAAQKGFVCGRKDPENEKCFAANVSKLGLTLILYSLLSS